MDTKNIEDYEFTTHDWIKIKRKKILKNRIKYEDDVAFIFCIKNDNIQKECQITLQEHNDFYLFNILNMINNKPNCWCMKKVRIFDSIYYNRNNILTVFSYGERLFSDSCDKIVLSENSKANLVECLTTAYIKYNALISQSQKIHSKRRKSIS